MWVTERYHKFMKPERGNPEYKKDFQEALKEFVNQLRKEVFDEDEIDFGTYDFIIGKRK